MLEDYPELLTFSETSEILRIKSTKLYGLLRSNKIKHYKDQGRYLIPKAAVVEYLESIIDNGQ